MCEKNKPGQGQWQWLTFETFYDSFYAHFAVYRWPHLFLLLVSARQFIQQQQYARRHFTCQKTAAGRRALLMCQPIRHHVTPLLLPQFTLPYLLTHFGCAFSMNKSPSVFIWALENYQALLWWKFRTGEFIREIAKLSFIVKGALIYDLIHCANILHVCACYSKGNAWIATKNR